MFDRLLDFIPKEFSAMHTIFFSIARSRVNIAPDEEFLRNGKDPVVTVMSAGHALHVFINSELSGTRATNAFKTTIIFSCLPLCLKFLALVIGTVYGGLAFPKLTYTNSVKLRAGINKISLLSVAVGLPVSLKL